MANYDPKPSLRSDQNDRAATEPPIVGEELPSCGQPRVTWDAETHSQCNLKERGAYIYADDPTTDIHFFCYAIDDGDVQVWRPGDPVPEPFANPTSYKFVSDNWDFERAIHAHVLVKRYGFPPIPIENQDCAQRL